jgi:nuclear pore complex protein Nup155
VRLPPPNLIHPDEQTRLFRPHVSTFGGSQFHIQPKPSAFQVGKLTDSAYSDGLTIIAQKGEVEGTDFILCFAPDLSRIGALGLPNLPQPAQPAPYTSSYSINPVNANHPPLTEYATVLTIPGRTWAAAAILKPSSTIPAGTPSPKSINELAYQFGEFPNQFVLLTNVGLTFLVKRRTLDFLKAALEELQSEGNVQPIIEFRDRLVVFPMLLDEC